jgi:MADS-box transcription factor
LFPRTFLKRKGGLFKKAHELSVLCSVDVAVFVFGNNKKLYEYSSADMRDLITRYQYVSSQRVAQDRIQG